MILTIAIITMNAISGTASLESVDTATAAELMTTVNEQTSATDSDLSTVTNDLTTVTDSQTQTGI